MLVLVSSNPAIASVPAFPGAEGFGGQTPGGRGGQVLFVTNLNDSGPGSLRAAIETPGPRIVVFRVGGTITLSTPLSIVHPFITIAGQTAPGGGIQIRNNPLGLYDAKAGLAADSFSSIEIAAHDVVIRYLRVRPGPLDPNPACTGPNAVPPPPQVPPTAGRCVDAGDIEAIYIKSSAHHVVLDHLSLAFASDEILDLQGSQDITLQHSIVAEGMNFVLYEGHFAPPGGFHGKGIITGDHSSAQAGEVTGRLSIHHNIWAHNSARNPQLGTYCYNTGDPSACVSDVVNNVTYNWDNFGANINNVLGHHYSNVIGNYYKPGFDQRTGGYNGLTMNDWTNYSTAITPHALMRVHFQGNRRELAGGTTENVPIDCVRWNNPLQRWDLCNATDYSEAQPFVTPAITTTSAEQALVELLATAGAYRRLDEQGAWVVARDTTDSRVVADVASSPPTGRIMRSFEQFPGWAQLDTGVAPSDIDDDGMPDQWERRWCFDPGNPSNASQDADADGYTEIEEFLNHTPPRPDLDLDEVGDLCDNCPTVANSTQLDRDANLRGDACEAAAIASLSIAKSGANLELSWSSSCSADDNDYAVYRGELAAPFASHLPETCSTGGTTSITVNTPAQDSYFLVSAIQAGIAEGSLGAMSTGERTAGPSPCLSRAIGGCP